MKGARERESLHKKSTTGETKQKTASGKQMNMKISRVKLLAQIGVCIGILHSYTQCFFLVLFE